MLNIYVNRNVNITITSKQVKIPWAVLFHWPARSGQWNDLFPAFIFYRPKRSNRSGRGM